MYLVINRSVVLFRFPHIHGQRQWIVFDSEPRSSFGQCPVDTHVHLRLQRVPRGLVDSAQFAGSGSRSRSGGTREHVSANHDAKPEEAFSDGGIADLCHKSRRVNGQAGDVAGQ